MDVHNLATVIAPGVLRPDDGKLPPGPTNAAYAAGKNISVSDGLLAIEAVSCMIEFVDTMAEVPKDIAEVLNDKNLMGTAGSMTSAELIKKFGANSEFAKPSSFAASPPALVSVPENAAQEIKHAASDQGNPRRLDRDIHQVQQGLRATQEECFAPASRHADQLDLAQLPKSAPRAMPGRDDRRNRWDKPNSQPGDAAQGAASPVPNALAQGNRPMQAPPSSQVHNFSHPNLNGPTPPAKTYAAYQPYCPTGPTQASAASGQLAVSTQHNQHAQSISSSSGLSKSGFTRERDRDQTTGAKSGRDSGDERYQKQRGPITRSRRPGTSSSQQITNGSTSDREAKE
ncbi:hypothetical protein KEM52_004204 [Ascosphaera acerosa]|nr:hypothetical protein KEM52_004204 [Ascosphaera acerosa]